MVSLQIISKILNTGDFSIIINNQLDKSYFGDYSEEFEFLKNYYDKYKSVPDKETFLDRFSDFEILDVKTDDDFLVYKIREEYLATIMAPILNKGAEMFNNDAVKTVEYLKNALSTIEAESEKIGGVDIIKNSTTRYTDFVRRINNQNEFYFKSGFPELDQLTHGIQRGEELLIIFARVNQGKSWVLEKMCVSVWEQGYNVGYISPEMTASSVGYRFDTLYKNFSNEALMWGEELNNNTEYEEYLKNLQQHDNKLIVATPLDFGNKITVSKLKSWIKQNKLDMIAIDGLTYMSDERGNSRDNKTTMLTNISEDLMGLSVEMGLPILAVVQANRSGVAEENSKNTPELDTIRDSDGMAMNASKVLSIRQRDGILDIGIKKQRNGKVGGKISYLWDIDRGKFTYVPGQEDPIEQEAKEAQIKENKELYSDDIESVF